MKNTVLKLKCKNCGADLKFNVKTGKLECSYCGSSFKEEELNQTQLKEDVVNNENVELNEYSCPGCGAIVVTDKDTSATECVYCGSSAIIKNRLEGKFKPDKIITFKTKKEDAITEFENFVKKRWFSPKEFESKENIEKTTGVYIPFWLFDCETNGDITVKCKKYTHWSDYNYRYTKTETFECRRCGTMSFTDIPADGSKKFPDDIMDSIEPYDYKEFKPFNYSYLSGFLAEKYDLDSNEVLDRAKVRAENTTGDKLISDLGMYSDHYITKNIIEVHNGAVEYALLPVWMLNINYKGQMYTFAMNGQTGKMMGNVPIDKKKMLLTTLKLFSTLFIIGIIISFILGGN